MEDEEGKREGGMGGGGKEGRRDGRTERGKEDGNPSEAGFVRPTLEYASAICDLFTTTQTVSLIISETNRTVKRHIITCK